MEPDPIDIMIATLPMITMLGLLILAALWIWRKGKIVEMQHRERLAMIEKGLMPPPEARRADPAAASMYPAPGTPFVSDHRLHDRPANTRFRTLGITVVGIGFALMLMIGVAGGSMETGVGIGGAIAVFGAALVVNAYLGGRDTAPPVHAGRRDGPENTPPAL